MKIEQWPVSKLIPYLRNNRTHSQIQIDRIAASIKEFGFNQPVVVDESGIILVGHGRLLAAQKLELEKIPVIVLKNLSSKQKRAYRILDNKLQNDSAWDYVNLELELKSLHDEGLDFAPWGLEKLQELFSVETGNDAKEEWQGMPEFSHEDKTAYRSIVVHFKSQVEINEFAEKIEQTINPKTRWLWYSGVDTIRYGYDDE